MKNTFLRLTAAVLSALMLTACDSKKTENEPIPEPEDTAIEQPFMELSSTDFKEINVTLTLSEDTPYVNVEQFDTADFDFGKRLPPCKAEGVWEEFVPYYVQHPENFYNYDERVAEEYEKSLTTPSEGEVISAAADRENIYFAVNYDTLCLGNHETAIFGYNTVTETLTELYTFSGTEKEYYGYGMTVAEGTLYAYIGDTIYAVDSEAHEVTGIFTNVRPEGSYERSYLYNNSADKLIIAKVTPINPDIEDYENFEGEHVRLLEYDPETGEWNEFYSYDTGGSYFGSSEYDPFIYSDILAWKEKPEGSRKYDVVTDYYRLSTGLSNFNLIYASRDRVIGFSEDYSVSTSGTYTLHCFDLTNNEHYVLDADSYGGRYSACGGNVLVSADSMVLHNNPTPIYYLIPEIGMIFDIAQNESLIFPSYSDGTVSFLTRSYREEDVYGDGYVLDYEIDSEVLFRIIYN